MESTAIGEAELRRFLLRKRHRYGDVEVPALSPFLCQTLELVAKLVPAEAGSISLDDPTAAPNASPLTVVAAFGPGREGVLGEVVPAGQGVVGRVFDTGETLALAAPRRDSRYVRETDGRVGLRARSLIAAPVRIERRVCGVLALLNRRERRAFTKSDVVLVEHLAQHVSGAVTNAVDVLKQNYLATHDALTGLRNARALEGALREELDRARRRKHGADPSKRDVALLFVDVDRLKSVNDRLGHRAGSEAIRRVAKVTEEVIGDRGEVFRFGGDEMIVVCPRTGRDTALELGTEVRRAVRKGVRGPMRGGGMLPTVTVSIGTASLLGSLREGGGNLPSRLLGAADHALYRAKAGGRDRCITATRRDDTLKPR